MFELRPINPGLLEQALEKAKRYRLLNEPAEAESICLDILEVDLNNQEALIWLVLSLTDQIALNRTGAAEQARKLLSRLESEYDREYYAGIICERLAKHRYRTGAIRSGFVAYEDFMQALQHYERAEKLSTPDNDDAKLRWNCCARILNSDANLRPEPEAERESMLLE